MASKNRVWREGDTWAKVAYLTYFDSREFRALLDLNQSFDIRSFPAQGVPVFTESPGGAGAGITTNGATSLPGTLQQNDVNIDLRGGASATERSELAADIFPWDTFQGFANRLSQYTAASLLQKDRMNGFSLDSPQATSDSQRG